MGAVMVGRLFLLLLLLWLSLLLLLLLPLLGHVGPSTLVYAPRYLRVYILPLV
jgi:hypothetical protein